MGVPNSSGMLKVPQRAERSVLPTLQERSMSMHNYCYLLADLLEVS